MWNVTHSTHTHVCTNLCVVLMCAWAFISLGGGLWFTDNVVKMLQYKITLRSKASDNHSCICGASWLAIAGGQYYEITFIESHGISVALQFKLDFTSVNVFTFTHQTKALFCFSYVPWRILTRYSTKFANFYEVFCQCTLYLELCFLILSWLSSFVLTCHQTYAVTAKSPYTELAFCRRPEYCLVVNSLQCNVAAAPPGSIHSKKPLGLIRI